MGTVVAAVTALVGCEWTGSDDGTTSSWNQNYDIVSFSATYRGDGGAPVAISTSAQVETPGTSAETITKRVTNERVGTTVQSVGTYMGSVAHFPVVSASLTLSVDGMGSYIDNGAGRLVDENGLIRGTFVPASGTWTLTLVANEIPAGKAITASYTYNVTLAGQPGSVSNPTVVQTITVSQTGEHLTMNASNGMVFTGQINGMNIPATVTPQSVIVAKFSVASGSEKIVGTLTDTSTQRILSGSWVHGQETLDVAGYAGPATRSNAMTTTTTAPTP
jgi:hypothetical protein